MIEVKQLCKSFSERKAVDQLSFSVREGEFYSLLGPNGAGKSTTINVLNTLFPPLSGSVKIAGYEVGKENKEIKKVIGIVPQEIALYDDLTAYDNLYFFGSLYGLAKSKLNKRIDQLLHEFGLFDRKNERVKTFSGGMKRRINIATALLHEPKLLFMDEPTVGIDPQSRNNIYEAIQKLKNEKTTILYTTHYMEEAERFSDRIGIIDKGTIIAEGTLEELKKISNSKESIIISFSDINEEQGNDLKKTIQFDFDFENSNTICFFVNESKGDLPKIITKCFEAGLEVSHIDIQHANLESVFLSLTGKKLRD